MPREGYKCITVKAEVYDYYYTNWLAHKKEYTLKGISSFSGYITYILTRAIEEKNDC